MCSNVLTTWYLRTAPLPASLPALKMRRKRGREKWWSRSPPSASCWSYLAASAFLSLCFVYFRRTARGHWLLSPLEDAHSALCADGWQSVGATKALQLCHLLVRFSHIAELVNQVTLGVWCTCSKYSVGILTFFLLLLSGTVYLYHSCQVRSLFIQIFASVRNSIQTVRSNISNTLDKGASALSLS